MDEALDIDSKLVSIFFGAASATGLFSALIIVENLKSFIPQYYASIIFVGLYLLSLFVTSLFIKKWFKYSYILAALIWLLVYIYIKMFGPILD